MPEYLAPGVYVEEVAHPAAISGAPTTVTAFVGPTLSGPLATDGPPPLVTSVADFENRFGGQGDLVLDGVASRNYLARAVHAFFAEGGGRLHIARTSPAPTAADYEASLDALLAIEAISLVAAPAAWALPTALATRVNAALVAHAETAATYRFAVLDPPANLDVTAVRDHRSAYDTARAALYYPWIIGSDGVATPPSGAICGVYARVDASRGVSKAPANEVLNTALDLQASVSDRQQELLNPEGVNCIRRFDERRGVRVWGARTLSADPETKYVNVSRYRAYLAASIDRGLGWTVFEANDEPLWAQVRQAVSDFLFQEWRQGALAGSAPDEAYFVRCDRTTMDQNDLANGRLVCLVGAAQLRPAEYGVLRIVKPTAEARP